jgi:acetyl-CoA carboxylase biotin carboxyl carrier protein
VTRLGGRLHARTLEAIIDPPAHVDGRHVRAVRAPRPGWFAASALPGDAIQPGGVLGRLEVLGTSYVLLVPRAHGMLIAPEDPAAQLATRAVGFGDVLGLLDLEATPRGAGELAGTGDVSTAATSERVFRAPTSGRFYGRPAPDKPAFVEPGTELVAGATICLLEVMKTFHRVTYVGEPARVAAVLVADGDDVNAGDPLLALA